MDGGNDAPGTSVTNATEHLASFACDTLGIDPGQLVWVEHYGYPSAARPRDPRGYDLVTFARREPDGVRRWSAAVLRHHPDGWPGYFEEPDWRPMEGEDWTQLGVDPGSAT